MSSGNSKLLMVIQDGYKTNTFNSKTKWISFCVYCTLEAGDITANQLREISRTLSVKSFHAEGLGTNWI